jgi:hopanoid biosynthesis associated RND transporter like protein HpnN
MPEQELDDPSWMAAPLRRLTAWIVARPWATLAGVLVLSALSLLITVTGLKFKLSRLDLLNPQSEYNQRWLAYLEEFGDQDDAVLVVQGDDTGDVLAAIDDLALELKRPDQPFESVMSEWDLSKLRSKGLHFLPAGAVLQLDQQLRQLKPLLAMQPALPDEATSRLRDLNDRLEPISRLSPEQAELAEQEYGQLLAAIGRSLASTNSATPQDVDVSSSFEQLEEGLEFFKSHHLLMNDGQTGVVLLRLKEQPGEATRGATAITHLRQLIDAVRPRHLEVQIGLTGMPILEYDEMTASQGDMARSTWLSFVCVLVFFWASFGSWRHTLLSNLTLLVGMIWSFGYLTLVVGHLNILSVAFAAIVIGIGIDFSIHYISHYLNYRARGMASGKALIETATYVGPGVVTGAVTTALAFFTAAFTDFVGVVELGIIAGGGIVLCLIATVIALPAMVVLADRDRSGPETNTILDISAWLWPAKRFPRATLVASGVATVVICVGLKDLHYDHNLLNLQPQHLESVEIEREVLSNKDQSFWCALAMADDPDQARELKKQFESLETVSHVEEVGSLLPPQDESARSAVIRISAMLEKLPATSPQAPAFAPLLAELARAKSIADSSGIERLLPQVSEFQRQLATNTSAQLEASKSFPKVLSKLSSLQSVADPEPPRLADLPPPVADRYVGRSGKFLLRVYAKGHIWDMDSLKQFVADVESVDPHVTGHPVQTFYASRQMQRSYLQATLYSVLCVLGTLLLDYRSVKHTLLAMLPLVFGVVQMLGLMGWLGIDFNPANMIALPLILGMGVEEGVHLTHEFRRQKGRFQLGNSTAMAVMLTSATTIAGFACMIISRHQGLRSLGQILTFGMTTCLVVSLYGFFALLRWRTWQRPELAVEADDILPATFDDAEADMAAGPAQDFDEEYSEEPVRPLIRPTRSRVALARLADDRAA